jgi:hypothetical protein
MEHASVASFARATLQLLAAGAPPDLVADTQRAAEDEVRHARLAYGLASAYAGRAVGPGALDVRDAAPALGLRAIVRALVDEACIGETIGAAEAAEEARTCREPWLGEQLRELAADEARHAALAWRTLRWALHELPLDERRSALADLHAALARWTGKSSGLRARVLADVVAPAAAALGG